MKAKTLLTIGVSVLVLSCSNSYSKTIPIKYGEVYKLDKLKRSVPSESQIAILLSNPEVRATKNELRKEIKVFDLDLLPNRKDDILLQQDCGKNYCMIGYAFQGGSGLIYTESQFRFEANPKSDWPDIFAYYEANDEKTGNKRQVIVKYSFVSKYGKNKYLSESEIIEFEAKESENLDRKTLSDKEFIEKYKHPKYHALPPPPPPPPNYNSNAVKSEYPPMLPPPPPPFPPSKKQ